jgi:sulfite reductase (NADPH) flavoprotein alpha-component
MTALFSSDQWQRVQAVLAGLDQRQALWLSGYLAAPRDISATPKAAADSAVQVTIAYGSETGNSTAIAEALGRLLREQNIEPRLVPLAEVKPRTLARVQYLWIVCSTHGDGDPPEPAAPFFDALLSDQAPALKQLKFAVLALGDSTYDHFCTAGLALDRRLAELGAERLLPCVECDVDFKTAADSWVDKVAGLVPRPSAAVASIAAMPVAQVAATAPTRANPVELEVLENVCLTASGRRAAVHHLALLMDTDNLQLQPGDAVGVLPHNPPELVAAVLNVTGRSGDDPVVVDDQAMPLVQALREKLDLTIPGKPLLQRLAELTEDAQLQEINGNSKTQREFLRTCSVLDILRRYPSALDAPALAATLRPLQPRLYDIANAPGDDELHLTVQTYWYPHPNQGYPHIDAQIAGIASRYLTQLQPGERVRLYPHHNKRFRLPDDKDVPLILLASSTGVAPYRAFVQSLAAEGRRHPCWLLLREQRFEEDFLYQTDWQSAAKNGVLTKITTEFYEDQPNTRLADALAEDLADWVARGAHVYLCGDKEPLTELETALKENRALAEVWTTLNAGKRLHRNVY